LDLFTSVWPAVRVIEIRNTIIRLTKKNPA
jgi:hypothetical protein